MSDHPRLFDDNDPMGWRELLDLHAALPLWIRCLVRLRGFLRV